MRGELPPMWLEQLTIAVVERDFAKIEKLLEEIPALEADELQKVANILNNMTEHFEQKKEVLGASMRQMKKNIDFLNATQAKRAHRIDIKS